ncbi:MAG: TA system VapC family ribonuclease toxin, partial [Terriglobales bacterium]
MILPDVNLLLYATDQLSPFHDAAQRWWRACMQATEAVGLTTFVALGFVRLSTKSASFRVPLPVTEATGLVRSWLARPQVVLLPVESADLNRAMDMLDACGTAGNLASDAILAALALA